MTTLNYENTEKYLHSSGKFRINLGLDRISAILELLDNPQKDLQIIHIAGTNGKGSVCTLTAEILQQSGYKVGLYTSPHIFKYNERFKVNGEDISDEDFTRYISEVEFLGEKHELNLSEFEILTAVAFKYFYDKNVDFVILETGLGGRFDATNVVEKPLLTAITSISIDHKDRLGDTIEKIAFEKAGIVKKNVECVVNADNMGKDTISTVACEKSALMIFADKKVDILFENGTNYAVFDGKKHEFSLWGLHQKQNLSLVLKIADKLKNKGLKITENSINKALKTAFIPARFQYNKNFSRIIDGSHNADAALMLRKNLDFYFPNEHRIWVFGCLSTKEYEKVVNILFRRGDEVFLNKFDNKLSVSAEEIFDKIDKKYEINFKKFSKTENTLNYFVPNNLIIITGSFYMINELVNSL